MNIFIDTNIYLDYYRMSKDTLVSLKKLTAYLKTKSRARLLLPTQIENEFSRRRNQIIKESLRQIENSINNAIKLPKIFYDNKKITKSVEKIKGELQKYYKEAKKDLLHTDSEINRIIKSLFDIAVKIEDDDEIFGRAYKRMVKGNPPGKTKSIGDAIAWEIMLRDYTREPLYIISKDGDWVDETDSDKLKPFLEREWKKTSKKNIFLYCSIASFLNAGKKAKISKEIIKEEKGSYIAPQPILSTGAENLMTYSNKVDYSSLLQGYSGVSGLTSQPMFTAYQPIFTDPSAPFLSLDIEKKCSSCGKAYKMSSFGIDIGLCDQCFSTTKINWNKGMSLE